MPRKLTEVASRLSRPKRDREVIYIVDYENVPNLDVAKLLLRKGVAMVVLAANRTNTVTPDALETIEQNPERVEVIIGRVTRKEFVDKLVIAKVGEYAFRFPFAEIIVVANDRDYADLADHLNDHWEREVPIKHQAPGRARTRSRTRSRTQGSSRSSSEARASDADELPRKKASTRRRRGRASKKTTTEDVAADAPAATAAEAGAAKKTTRKKKATKKKTAADGAAQPAALDNPDAEAVRALLAKLPAGRRPKTRDALLNAIRNYRESVGLRARPSTILRHLQERGVLDARKSPVTYAL